MLLDERQAGPFHVGVLLENVPEYLFLLGGAGPRRGHRRGHQSHPPRRGAGPDIAAQRLPAHRDRLVAAAAARGARHRGGARPCVRRARLPGDPAQPDALRPRRTDAETGPGPARARDALYLLLFTSGSTGAPKAVRVSQGRMAAQAGVMAAGSGFGADDVMYCPMPMFHGNALNTCVVPAMASGAQLVLRRRFSASGFLPDVRRYGVTYFNYVGRALAYVLATPPAPTTPTTPCASGSARTGRPRTSRRSNVASTVPSSRGTGRARGPISMSRVPGTPPPGHGQASSGHRRRDRRSRHRGAMPPGAVSTTRGSSRTRRRPSVRS